MASDPSADPDSKRKHARKLTPLVPALPLSFSDKKWKKPSIATAEDVNLQPTAFTLHPSADPAPDSLPTGQETKGVPVSEQEGPDHTKGPIADLSAQTDEHIESQDVQADAVKEDGLSAKQEQQDSTGTAQPENSQLIDSTLESFDAVVQEAGERSPVSADSKDDADFETATVTPRERMRPPEEETQSSEQETSSQQPSSTTGLTDYGSSVAEPSLETLVDVSQNARKASGIPDRASEVAPEVLTNGFSPHSTSASQVSHTVNGSFSSQPRAPLEPASLPTIQDHLLFLASSKSCCDIVIQVNQADRSYQPSLHYAHSLVLVRSELLAKLMSECEQSTQPRVVNLHPARNILPHAFEAALRFFYSDQILTAQGLIPQVNYQEKQAKGQTFEYIMSYWMAGIELGLNPVKSRSHEMIKELIDWDVAELVSKEIQELRAAAEVLSSTHGKDEIRDIANMLSRLLSQLFIERLSIHDFSLDTNAQAHVLPTRFSQLEYNRPNNPALSGMVFGSLPSQAEPTPSIPSIASAIMLNMDFADLSLLAANLLTCHGKQGEDILRHVIEQREDRREHVISNRAMSNKQRLGNSEMWDPAGWKEYVTDCGQLERERVGFLLPTKGR